MTSRRKGEVGRTARPAAHDRQEANADLAARLALVSLPGLGPARASWLLAGASPAVAVSELRAGRLPPGVGHAPPGVTAHLVRRWSSELRAGDPAGAHDNLRRDGMVIIAPDHQHWPFTGDPEPPVLLFTTGHLHLAGAGPVVAIVGTRRCTALGRQVAFELGAELAEAGVAIASGLAVGIDAAAHAGALAAGGSALGVVASGLDVVYPRANQRLWSEVAGKGLLLSEAPPGTRPERWRFPARNRLIAALADVVVVVESHAEGGSLVTAAEAADRGRQVLAVPGSVTSPASVGSNQLLRDGCPPACSAQEVLTALGLDGQPRSGVARQPALCDAPAGTSGRPGSCSPLVRAILADVEAGACHLDQLVAASRATIPELLAEIGHLQALGLVVLDGSTVSAPERSL